MSLSNKQIAAYHRNGYLMIEQALTPEQLSSLQAITHERRSISDWHYA